MEGIVSFFDSYYLLIGFGLLGIGVGTISAMLGVGGGFLITPALHLAGLPMAEAAATALAQMIPSSFSASIGHIYHRHLNLKFLIWLGVPMIFGVWWGAKIQVYLLELEIGEIWTRSGFILFLLLMGMKMLFQRKKSAHKEPIVLPIGVLAVVGVFVGTISVILGVGGGFFVVPILSHFFGLPLKNAAAVSLLLIFGSSLFGTYLYFMQNMVHVTYALSISAGSLLGGFGGGYLSNLIPENTLRLSFGLLTFAASISMVFAQFGQGVIGLAFLMLVALSVFTALLVASFKKKN